MDTPSLKPQPRVTPRQILWRGIRGLCPNCGQAKLFRTLLRIHHRCPSCGMTLERGDGYYLGPLCINYALTAIGFVAPILMIGFFGLLPMEAALAIALLGALILPIGLYRTSWSCWLMVYYFCLPGELHANHPEDSDDLSFEEEKRS